MKNIVSKNNLKLIMCVFLSLVLALGLCACGSGKASTTTGTGDNSSLLITSLQKDTVQTFETVTFGTYEQDGNASNGAEPIETGLIEAAMCCMTVFPARTTFSISARSTPALRANSAIIEQSDSLRSFAITFR